MESKFWLDKWAADQIGFHGDEIHPMLEQHWQTIGVADTATVFVPLCGKSRDMVWLRERGHKIIGVELSEIAAQAFFSENEVSAECFNIDQFRCYQGGGYSILCGDIFALKPAHLDPFSCIYDRAALIALPPETRRQYVQLLRSLCQPNTLSLLVTVSYPPDEISPPPFLVADDEVTALYSAWCDCSVIGTSAAKVKGVDAHETAFRLQVTGR